MNVLSSPSKSFKIPGFNSDFFGTNSILDDFVIADNVFPNIERGSIVFKIKGELSTENVAIIGQIKAMKLLKDNWDETGALSIPSKVIERSIDIVKLINRFDFNVYLASPGPNNEVLLILKAENREIELIIYPDREKYVKFENMNFIEQGNIDNQKFHSLLEWLIKNE
ncbi:hypothetical protein MNBD_BACTEROID03-2035 [hydrothermal vent metagenome]|uniref:Uncharacterized protein n=1 Tax=hydrothermal vent metagenome TaxID=652676 RepID=A0A3B0T5F5_9ZZZZ